MKRIQISMTDESFETLDRTAEGLGITKSELLLEAYFYFATTHNQEISVSMREYHHQKLNKRQQRRIFFVKNWYRRIIMQTADRCKMFGTYNHPVILSMIKYAEEEFKSLDEKTQELLNNEFKMITDLRNIRTYEMWIENTLPNEAKQLKKIIWRK